MIDGKQIGFVAIADFPKKGTLITESISWAVDLKTGVKKALTSSIATQSSDEDDIFAANAAFGK